VGDYGRSLPLGGLRSPKVFSSVGGVEEGVDGLLRNVAGGRGSTWWFVYEYYYLSRSGTSVAAGRRGPLLRSGSMSYVSRMIAYLTRSLGT
jgi:hypothetical protein